MKCFNTASGRYIHSILFVFPSLRSGTRDVRTSSSLRSSAGTLRRIPQAVGTVATNYFGRHRPNWCHVSIPQAVSTVATPGNKTYLEKFCGVSIPQAVSTVATTQQRRRESSQILWVSIPQAVNTVATTFSDTT